MRKRFKTILVIPALVFLGVMFLAAVCAYTEIFRFEIVGDVPEKVYNCEDDQCEVTINLRSNLNLTKLALAEGFEEELIDFTELENGTYEVTIPLKKGVNNISLRGYENVKFKSLSFTIECVCPEEGGPEISWDPDKPPTDTTTEDTAKLNIKSDQLLNLLRVWNNGQLQIIENPEPVEEGDSNEYETSVPVEDGDNEIEIQGENENGSSNIIEHNIQKGHPPIIEFAEQPPSEVTNCENDECEVVITINYQHGINNIAYRVGNEDPKTFYIGSVFGGSETFNITLKKGPNGLRFYADNRFGLSNILTCNIECVCEETPSSPTIHLEPDLPPTTTNDTVPLNIKSDQELDQITVVNSAIAEPNVIDNPEPVENEDGFLYQTNQPLVEGDNDITVQGKNENGFSNLIGGNIEKGEPPVIAFAEQPPAQVSNCVDDECQVTITISCEDYLDEITTQVGEGDPYSMTDFQSDVNGNVPIPVTLQKGTNVITITAKNRFGTSNTLTCTIECVCDSPSSGYTKEQTIGETDIPKPIGLDFQPDYQQQKNYLNVLTRSAEDEKTEIKQRELTGGEFQDKYPGGSFSSCAAGYAFNSHTMEDLLMLMEILLKIDSSGNMSPMYMYEMGHTSVPGQIKFQDMDTSYITKNTTDIFFLNRNGAQVISSNNKFVGLDIMRDAYNNTALYDKTALGTSKQTGSDGRATEQSIITLANSGQVTELFDIPLSDGMIIDVITDVLPDHETVHFIVTTIKNETEYWVNIYNQAGERLDAFKTHDLSDLDETSGETIFYKVIKATDWPDDKLYIIHSEFPGVQVWAPEE